MFSKALFKQSCKANGTMWGIITVAVCFMLACVMLISGNGNIGEVRNSIQDTIIVKEIDAQLEKQAIAYYSNAEKGLAEFDLLFTEALKKQLSESPAADEATIAAIYSSTCEELQAYIKSTAEEKGIKEDSTEYSEILGSVMYTLNPAGRFNDFYTANGESVPADYDFTSLLMHTVGGDIEEYLRSDERSEYRRERAEDCTAVFLAGNMTTDDTVDTLLNALSDYGVTAEKYNSFGYTYSSIKDMAKTAVVTYRGRLEYELSTVNADYADGKYGNEAAYLAAVAETEEALAADISSSFLSTLPEAVSEALEEIGQADLYTLIVGSIFYKLAGLLLPIIYMIMASNNLISGQVDSGSMAYVLSTSTKRSTVVFTQAIYLIGSLLAMFGLTTATSCVCLKLVTEEVELTVKKLLLLNSGAFLVLLALSGLCFFTSCVFDRSKHSMAIGGGLSVFALVAAMLGLFGSPVIPSVVRLEALNNFNYATVISFFDVVSIMDGTSDFIPKFITLGVAGIVGYIAGSVRFIKKDLPL